MNWESIHRRRTEVLLAIYSAFSLIALVGRWDHFVRALKALLFFILAPTMLTLNELVSYGSHLGGRVPAMANAFYEAQSLRSQLRSYALLETNLRLLRSENERLRQTLGFVKKSEIKAVVCEVIARDPSNWFTCLIINRGEKQGVRSGAPVVAFDGEHLGLVGTVEEASGHSAKVLLITDPLSSVSVSIGSSGELAVLQGQGAKNPNLMFIVSQAEIRVGDEIVTAGLGQNFPEGVPKGIPIGFVTNVEPSSGLSFRQAGLQTYAHLSRLKEVIILEQKGISSGYNP